MPDIGLREILMVAVAITAAYLLLSVLRLLQIFRRKKGDLPAPPAERSEPVVAAAAEAPTEPQVIETPAVEAAVGELPPAPPPGRRWLPRWLRPVIGKAAQAELPGAWPGESAASFGDHLFRSTLETELQQLRSEVAVLREELKLLKAARRVSPQYNEAMMLAQRGADPQGIAEQCGISVGEAELVLALSRNKQEYEDYGEDDPRRSAG